MRSIDGHNHAQISFESLLRNGFNVNLHDNYYNIFWSYHHKKISNIFIGVKKSDLQKIKYYISYIQIIIMFALMIFL